LVLELHIFPVAIALVPEDQSILIFPEFLFFQASYLFSFWSPSGSLYVPPLWPVLLHKELELEVS